MKQFIAGLFTGLGVLSWLAVILAIRLGLLAIPVLIILWLAGVL